MPLPTLDTHTHNMLFTDYAKPTILTFFASFSDTPPHTFLPRMKNWIRSTLAFWKKNGPQSSDYKRRFVRFFFFSPPQRKLVGIVVL